MWLLHMEETDGVNIMHGRNGREYRLPEMTRFSYMVIAPRPVNSTSLWFLFSQPYLPAFL